VRKFLRNHLAVIGVGASALLAASAGLFAAVAFSASSAQTPSTTTTINAAVGTQGPTGPKGPAGPTGPAGVSDCPPGFVFGEVVVNHGGGKLTIATCIAS
jgi:hypothetical protein